MNAPFQSDQVFMPQCVTSAERCAAIWASLFDWAVVMFWNIIVVFCFSHGAVLNRELLHCTRSDSIEFIVCVCMRILHLLVITLQNTIVYLQRVRHRTNSTQPGT